MKQSLLILSAIVLGIVFPWGYAYTFLIKYSLMCMLFFAFLGVDFQRRIFAPGHVKILFLNITLPLVLFYAIQWYDYQLALTAFVISIPPTAAAAPVLAQFMRTDVSFVTASLLITSPIVASAIPFILPHIMEVERPIRSLDVLGPILVVVGVPMLSSLFIKVFAQNLQGPLLRFRNISFVLFLFNVWLGCGNATHFLQNEGHEYISLLPKILVMTGIICAGTFLLGEKLVAENSRLAGSLAMGRKNTMFGLWLSLTFVSPLVALGPISYILAQNAYNSYQLWRISTKGS